MQDIARSSTRRQHPKIPNYLSEYESHDTLQQIKKQTKYQSVNMMRKLQRLWNKQKYLTDDQHQIANDSNRPLFEEDSSMEYKVEESPKPQLSISAVNFTKRKNKKLYQIANHQRVVSSSDQYQSMPQKMKKTRNNKQQIKTRQNLSMKEQTLELASFGSALQDSSAKY